MIHSKVMARNGAVWFTESQDGSIKITVDRAATGPLDFAAVQTGVLQFWPRY